MNLVKAKEMVSKKKVEKKEVLAKEDVKEAIDILKGATTIVYPMVKTV